MLSGFKCEKLKLRLSTGVLALIAIACSAHAQDESKADVLNELSYDYAECTVFYKLSQQCFKNQAPPSQQAIWEKAAERAREASTMFGRAGGLSLEALKARYLMAVNSMAEHTSKNCINVSVQLVKYADKCKLLIEDPMARLKQILAE